MWSPRPHRNVILRSTFSGPTRRHGSDRHQTHLSTAGKLTMGRHRGPDVAKLVIERANRRGKNLNPRQRAAIALYRRNKAYDLDNRANYHEQVILEAFFAVFDDLFFGGVLNGRCRIKFSQTDSREAGMLGVTDTDWDNRDPTRPTVNCVITVYVYGKEPDRRKRLIGHLGTVLHEMCHVYLDIWMCTNKNCNEQLEWTGMRGHGFAFQDIAYAMAKATMDKDFLNLPLAMNRCSSLVKDLNLARAAMPDLRRWGMQDIVRYRNGIYEMARRTDE